MDDGKYIMTLDNEDHEVIVSTLLEGQYPCKDTRQFVCIPCHFPIPLGSWLLKDAAFRPAAQHSVQADERKALSEERVRQWKEKWGGRAHR